ncbi:hypothetical protein JMF89_14465 [Clostridiaceae bacterium UIB06]|nr:hypothetical protein [Clostridiaceae bacterium UIB06]
MNILNYFDNREDCKKLLDGFDFKYFIPYFHDWVGYNRYTVQLNKEGTKVVYCSLDSIEDGLVKDSFPFFDIERLQIRNKEGILVNAFPLAQAGESLRRYVRGKKYLEE